MTKLYTIISANTIMAKLTNHVQPTRLITSSTDKQYSLDSEDDFRSGCRNVSHQQHLFSEQLSRTIKLSIRTTLSFVVYDLSECTRTAEVIPLCFLCFIQYGTQF